MIRNVFTKAIRFRVNAFVLRRHISISTPQCTAFKSYTSNARTPVRSFHREISQRCYVHPEDDTIYALSTGSGKAGIAIVRISGPSCLDVGISTCCLKRDLTTTDLQRSLPLEADTEPSIRRSSNSIRSQVFK
jgi:hypothetical protein